MSDLVPAEDQFYSSARVAELFDVTIETVVDWIAKGLLSATKVNGRWRITRSSVLALANSKFGPTN